MVEHPRYGTQFNVSSYEIKEPSDKDGIIMYLSSGMFKGIGEKTAKNLVDVLGENVISIIKEDYKSSLNDIHSLTKKSFFDILNDNFIKSLEPEYN